jgi:hypothetical protein
MRSVAPDLAAGMPFFCYMLHNTAQCRAVVPKASARALHRNLDVCDK